MTGRRNFTIVAALLALWCGYSVAADESAFAGKWMLHLEVTPGPVVGLLELEREGGQWIAHIEGGPATVVVHDDSIELVADYRDIAGFVFERQLVGRLIGDGMAGELTIVDEPDSPETGARWTATRIEPKDMPTAAPPRPVDLSGTWVAVQGLDFRKYSMDLTPAAEAWHQDYLLHLDQPNVRCAPVGLVALETWSYPFEVLQTDERITILYEVDSEVRRIYLDGRKPPDFYPNSPMGFSTAHWVGSTLVVETQLMAPNVRDFRGEPISENATVEERFDLSEDGTTLSAVITLNDPENYVKPPIRRRMWHRDPNAVILPYECDPDSFFRQLYEEGKIDEYMERANRRL